MRRTSAVATVLAVLALLIAPTPSVAQVPTSPPGAPVGVTASAGTLSATVHWSPSGSAADSYTVTSIPGGITVTVDGTVSSATVTGLGYLMSYTFTVTGTNSLGTGPASGQSNAVTPGPPGGPYHQGFAATLLNHDISAGHPLATNLGDDPVHLPGLTAVVVNLTASSATVATAVQAVVNQAVVATISVAPGQVQSSLVVVAVPAQLTQAALQITAGAAHVQLDFVGYFTGPQTLRDHSGLLTMIAPATLLGGPVAAGSTTNVPVLGQGGLPPAHVGEVLLNVTASNGAGTGAFTLLPTGGFGSGITTLGFAAGQATANRAIVAVPSAGSISVIDRGAAATIHIEVLGWFSDGTDTNAIGGLYNSLTPARLVDTSATGGPIAAGSTVTFPVYGHGGAPPVTATAPPTSVVVAITAVAPTGAGSVTAAGVAVVDYGAGDTALRTALVHLASDGSVTIGVVGSATNITVDLVAYFAGDLIVPGSTKVMTPDLLASIAQLSASSDFVTFKPGTQVSPFIQVDDVIAAGISPATPQGFLLRVLRITTQPDGTVVLGTRQAALSEALTAYSIDGVIVPSFSRFGMRPNHTLAVAPVMTAGVTVNPCPGPPANTSIDPRCPELTLGNIVALANAVAAGTFPQLNSDGSVHLFPVPWADLALTDLEVQVLPHFHVEYNFFSNTAKASFAWSVGFKLALELVVSKDLLSSGLTLASITFPIGEPFPVPIGPLVVVVTPTLTLALTLDASISAGLRFAYHFDRWSQVTESYDGSAFHTSNLDQTYVNGFDPPAFEANAEAKIALHAGPGLSFYGNVLTVGVDFNRFLKGTATVTCTPQPSCFPNPWWTLSSGVCIGVFMNIQLFFVFNKFFHVDLGCVEQVLLQAPGPHLNVVITPSSATVPRLHVQHFHAVVSNSPSGVSFSVLGGPANGTLSNGLLTTDVDYTAPGTPGDYKLEAAAIDDPSSVAAAQIHVPADPPSSPTSVGASLAGPTSITVTWAAPADSGGVPITDYKVVSSDGTTIDAGTSTSVTFTGLIPGTTYSFAVSATNQANLTSAPSAVSNSITTPAAGPMSVVPTSIDFGTVTLGQSSQPQTVVITADGTPLVISPLSLGGGSPGEFSIQNDTCSGQTLQPGGTCSLSVLYVPTQQIAASATVIIIDSDPTSPQQVTLSGSSPVQAVSGVVPVFDVQMIDSQTGYALEAALGSAVLKTTDGGKTWSRLILPAFDQVNATGGGYNFRFIDAMHGFVGAYRSLQPAGRVQFILSTSDGGQTWQQISIPSGIGLETLWFSDSLHGWIVGGIAGPPPPPGSLVNSTLAAVYATVDGGSSWTQQTLPDPIIAGTPGCIGQEGNVSAAFTDGSNGWLSAAVLCFAPNATITTQGTLFWTTGDGGATWTPHQPSGLITVSDRIQVTGASQVRQVGVLKVNSNFQQVLVSSDDGGTNFTLTPLPGQNGQPAAVTFSDGTHGIFVTTDGHVWRTTDGGATWLGNTLPRFVSSAGRISSYGYRAVASPDGTNIWVTGDVSYGFPEAGFIEMSSDGGATWTVQLLGNGS